MSVQSRSPLRMAGANMTSGSPNTGELTFVRGGSQRAVVWSGSLLTNAAFGGVPGGVSSGGHVLIASGAGRLNSILPHVQMASGLAVFFYDAAVLTVSGTSVSGQAIIGVLPPTYGGAFAFSGVIQQIFTGEPFHPDVPFYSGLCAAVPSGTPGFTITYTPETTVPTAG